MTHRRNRQSWKWDIHKKKKKKKKTKKKKKKKKKEIQDLGGGN
jgi:hypothetical protein